MRVRIYSRSEALEECGDCADESWSNSDLHEELCLRTGEGDNLPIVVSDDQAESLDWWYQTREFSGAEKLFPGAPCAGAETASSD